MNTNKTITIAEKNLREKFKSVYGPLVENFYKELEKLHLSQKELNAVPSLFLPGCGKFYAQSLIRVAVIGESTLRWNDGLAADLQQIHDKNYDLTISFKHFQEGGPVSWGNRFWKYHAQVLEKIYSRRDALTECNPIFSGVAWGNCFALEPYRDSGSAVDTKSISGATYGQIASIANKYRISGLENFVEVFSPNVIIYTCRNNYGSDNIFPKGCILASEHKQPEGWVIKIWKYRQTNIIQTQHPSWLSQYKHVKAEIFGQRVAEKLIELKCFAPVAMERHYCNFADAAPIFAGKLDQQAIELSRDRDVENMDYEYLRSLSYKLFLALALELTKQRATMTASLACKLLNQIDIFKQKNFLYSPLGRGPCRTVAGAWRRFDWLGEKEHATAIAEAFTKNDGAYAWQ